MPAVAMLVCLAIVSTPHSEMLEISCASVDADEARVVLYDYKGDGVWAVVGIVPRPADFSSHYDGIQYVSTITDAYGRRWLLRSRIITAPPEWLLSPAPND